MEVGDRGCEGMVGEMGGRVVRRWAVCRGYMTQHIDLSLVGRVRGGRRAGEREGGGGV